MDVTNLTQTLADLQITTIVWFAVIVTMIRLFLLRLPAQAVRVIVEFVEAILIAGVLVYMVIQPFSVKAFYIPSGSMLPTLIEDDHILVNKFLYRFEKPERSDVVVFNAPPEALEASHEDVDPNTQIDYIKRLIGLPGDRIQVVAGYVKVAGQEFHHADVREALGLANTQDSYDHQHCKFVPGGVMVYDGTQWTMHTAEEVGEKLGFPGQQATVYPGYVIRNGVRLTEPYIAEDPDYNMRLAQDGRVILDAANEGVRIDGHVPEESDVPALRDESPGAISPGHVIVMGDNRNDSNDSTRWGQLDETRLVGKAVFIFYPFNRIQMLH